MLPASYETRYVLRMILVGGLSGAMGMDATGNGFGTGEPVAANILTPEQALAVRVSLCCLNVSSDVLLSRTS